VTSSKVSYIDLCLNPSYIATLGKEMRKKKYRKKEERSEALSYPFACGISWYFKI